MTQLPKPGVVLALLLAAATVGATVPPASAQPPMNRDDTRCGATVAVAAPADFALRIVESGGPGPGWRAVTTIDPGGLATSRAGRPRTPAGERETRRQLSRADLDRIWGRVVACSFFALDRTYTTRGILDGTSLSVTAQGGGRSHTVNVHMYRVERLNDVVRTAREVIAGAAAR